MTAVHVVQRAIEAFDRSGIAYCVTGSLASNLYGISRATQDADFIVEVTDGVFRQLNESLGREFECDPQVEFETVTGSRKRRYRDRDTQFELEVFYLGEHPFDRSRFQRRVRRPVLEREAWVMTAEDVVVQKLRWLALADRNKDRDDVETVLALQFEILDFEYIRKWCDELEITELLDQTLKRIQS